jgi:hypothetical protein
VHLTESCDADVPRLITHVETISVDVLDNQVVEQIHVVNWLLEIPHAEIRKSRFAMLAPA